MRRSAFENDTSVLVGQQAKDIAEVYPDRVVQRFQRVLGDPDFVFEVDGMRYDASEIAAC